MKGIFFSRGEREFRYDFAPPEGEVQVPKADFVRLLPENKITGKENRNLHWVRVWFSPGDFFVTHPQVGDGDAPTFQLGEFSWGWDGCGVTEHWFDDSARLLAVKGEEYISQSGLTAGVSAVVAYRAHIEVQSFREDCTEGGQPMPTPGVVRAGYCNSNTFRGQGIPGRPMPRSDWTGFAVSEHAIGDQLDKIIELELALQLNLELARPLMRPVTCRHLSTMATNILTEDPDKTSRFLCTACRLRGVRLEEFVGRNQADMCPYFRRLAKAVVEKSDALPEWFKWEGDNLIASYRRLRDGEYEAFEVTYVRRKEGFVRRAVLLLQTRTREAWMYPYNGFIPKTASEFVAKYTQGRQILGYMASRPVDAGYGEPRRCLSEQDIRDLLAQASAEPIWEAGNKSLLPMNDSRLHGEEFENFSVHRGNVAGLEVVPLTQEGEEDINQPATEITKVFYSDDEAYYILIDVGGWNTLALRIGSQELVRSEDRGMFWLKVMRRS